MPSSHHLRDLSTCRVCGLVQSDLPWGEDGRTASFLICHCCGVEFGYEDSTPQGVARYRKQWLARGAPWNDPSRMPPGWNLADQLAGIPAPWKDAE